MRTNLAQALVFASFLIHSAGLNAQSINRAQIVIQNLFPLPKSKERLTGSRQPETQRQGVCIHVTALVPEYEYKQIWGSTFADYPTFWFYVNKVGKQDDSSKKFFEKLTFKLKKDEENEVISQQTRDLTLSYNKPKILKISVDDKKDKPLKIGEKYLWELSISCHSEIRTGWLEVISVPVTTDLGNSNEVKGYISKAKNDDAPNRVWYNILNDLMDEFCATSNNPKENIKSRPTWTKLVELLEKISLENLITEPLPEVACEEEKMPQAFWSSN